MLNVYNLKLESTWIILTWFSWIIKLGRKILEKKLGKSQAAVFELDSTSQH